MINNYIYDFDDTLVDSKKFHIEAYKKAIHQIDPKIQTQDDEEFYKIFNTYIDYGIDYVMKNIFFVNDDTIKSIKLLKKDLLDIKSIKIKQSVFDKMIKDCHKYIISNASYSNIEKIFESNDINEFAIFRDIMSPDLFFKMNNKPDPGMGIHLINKYHLIPSQCVYIGDSHVDKLFADNCGFEFQHVSMYE